ncbi:MAG: LacI family DNA-binding transcriptional regulator [Clostridia bacterium]|nr:LacI family DNA-binding transcriptional regulator [Clostridia bacterium]
MRKNTEKMTIEKIAKKLGVATCTVSKALNNATDVSEKTRKKVLDYAANIGFSLKRRNCARRFCVLIANSNTDENNEYTMLNGFQTAAKKHRTEIVVETYCGEENFDFDNYLSEKKIDGAFIIGNMDKKLADQLVTSRFPAVLADSLLPVANVSETDTDYSRAISDMVTYLVSLGHNKIGFLNHRDRGEKFGGYVAGMLSNNLKIDTNTLVRIDTDDFDGCDAAKTFCGRSTAVVCASDDLAAGLIRGLKNMGVNVPDQMSVTGFGDTKIAEFFTPRLTTLKIDYSILGQTAYNVLAELACGGTPRRILLNGEIIPRESTKKIE